MQADKPVFSGRLLCMACAAYTFGIAVYALFSPPIAVILAVVSAFVICALFKKLPYLFTAIILCLAFTGGFFHYHILEKVNDDFQNRYSGRYVTVSGRISDVYFTDNESQQITVTANSISAPGKKENKKIPVCIYTDLEKTFSVGDNITFSAIFSPFRRTSSHSFDSETYFHTKSIQAVFSLSSKHIITTPGNPDFRDKLLQISRGTADKVRSLTGSDEVKVASAILLGDKSGFSDEIDDIFRKSGISHVVTISGMHLSILTALFFSLTARTRLHYKIRNLLGILLILFYMAISGFSPSVTRAGIMIFCVLFAAIFDRKDDVVTSFFLSAAIILAFNPYSIRSAGFLLSYTSLAGILTFAKPVSAKLNFLPRFIPAFIKENVAMTFSATIFTLPVLAYIFNSVSLVSVITNLLVVPFVSIIFISVLITVISSFMYAPVAAIVAYIPRILIKFILFCAKTISSLPYSTINVKTPGIIWIVCFSVVLILFYLRVTDRKSGTAGAIAISAVICTVAISASLSALTSSVTFFDIGQGDCALIKLPGFRHCLIDTGPDGTAAVSALKSAGVNNLDIVFISHADNDHCGALGDILATFPTRKVVMPGFDIMDKDVSTLADIATKAGAHVEFADSRHRYSFAGMTADVLWPDRGESPADKNDGSLVLKILLANKSFLFTGDISTLSEHCISDMADADILKVSHHGSGDSSSAEFLNAVSPRYSVISVGKYNHYDHPDGETLLRLEECGSKILRTDLLGDISFNSVLNGNMEVRYETD